MKLYILVKDTLTPSQVAIACAHAGMIAYLKYKDDPVFNYWLTTSFKKCICSVSEKEFESAKKIDKCWVTTESSIKSDNKENAIICCPREEWPKAFKFYKLYKGV